LRLATVVPSGKDRSLTQSGDSDLIDRLVRHGLGQGEARCYVGMLAQRAFKVSEVATDDVEPTSHPLDVVNVWGEDEPRPSISLEEALANARDRSAGFFKVPPA
jgi:aspartyl-tRNA(Asn)/glutamyl-tRNA(Gln) amidotransferase subunit C